MTPERKQSLITAISRLRREIAKLEAKPAPNPADYADARRWKAAVTRRKHAIGERRNKIAGYEAKLRTPTVPNKENNVKN